MMRQFFAFVKWIPCKLGRIVLKIHNAITDSMDEDLFITTLLGMLILLFGMMVGLLTHVMLLLFGVIHKGTTPHASMLTTAGIPALYFVALLIRKMYNVFLAEQNELFNKLKENYHE